MYIQKARRWRGVGDDEGDGSVDWSPPTGPDSGTSPNEPEVAPIVVNEQPLASQPVTPADFNTTSIPGVCKPMNLRALGVVQEMQRQANRVAQAKGYAMVSVDGEVGPKTRTLIGKILGETYATCLAVASYADVFGPKIKAIADALGAPATVSAPSPPKPVSTISPAGVETKAPPAYQGGILDSLMAMSTGQKLAAAALVGGIGYLIATKKKRRK